MAAEGHCFCHIPENGYVFQLGTLTGILKGIPWKHFHRSAPLAMHVATTHMRTALLLAVVQLLSIEKKHFFG